MELTNDFVIDRGIDETWKILNDLEFIAPCMPGAKLTEVEGDEYRGLVKIKVGPITANYKGKASFVEQDEANHTAKLKAEGRDPRQGNANAMVTAKMEPVSDDQTKVTIHTDLGLSGKLASFGRGAIEDVSKKILGQFTENLRKKLADEGTPSDVAAQQAADDVSDAADSAAESVSSGASDAADKASDAADKAAAKASDAAEKAASVAGAAATKVSKAADTASTKVSKAADTASTKVSQAADTASTKVRKINSPDPEPVDLLSTGGAPVAKKALPAVGAAAIIFLVLRWFLKRR